MPTVSLPNASIRYELSGRGDPTVLVHGSLADRTSWEPVRARLAPSLNVLVYDRRGHGESTGPARSHPVRDDASDLAHLLEALDLFPVHLIAHSYGSAVALRLAVDRPEMVRSLLFHEPPFFGLLEDDPATAPEAERLYAEVRSTQSLARAGRKEDAARAIVETLSAEEGTWNGLVSEVRQGLLRYVEQWAEEIDDPGATRPDRTAFAEILIPVLATTGELSPPFLHRIAALLADAMRNATLRTLPEVGHVPHRSDPDAFVALVHGFLVNREVPFT